MINRFDRPVNIRNSYLPKQYVPEQFIPKEFVPNFKLYDKALQANQGQYNKLRDLSSIPIDALDGADTKYAQELRTNLDGNIDSVVQQYKKSISAGARSNRDLQRQIKKDVLPGGNIYELAQRKKQFTDFYSEQSKRLAKGDITNFQFQESVSRAKEDYDTAGGYKNNSNLNLSQRQNAIKFDDFANDFLKNFKANKGMSSDISIVDGKLVYDTKELTQLEADKVLKDLSQAYYNSASQTGQLNDRYSYLSRTGNIKPSKDNRSLAQNILTSYSSPKNKKDIITLQKELNKLGYNLKEDGKMGKNTKKALDKAADLASMTDSQFKDKEQQDYLSNYINTLAQPYADAKSYREYAVNAKSFGDTMSRAKALKKAETFTMRFDGQSVGVNYGTRPKSTDDINNNIKASQTKIEELQKEMGTVKNPNRLRYINDQIKYQQSLLSQQESIKEQALSSIYEDLDDDTRSKVKALQPVIDDILDLQGQDIPDAIQRRVEGMTGKSISRDEALDLYYKTSQIKQDTDDWIENNSDEFTNQLETVELSDKERKRIQTRLNANDFVFFDESGPIENVKESRLFRKDKAKPIISDKVKVVDITKSGFGEFGNMVTIEDEEGKVYMASPRNSNMTQVIGQNIMEENEPGSQQYITGVMMSNPEISGAVSQIMDMNYGDSKLVNGVIVEKSKPASGKLYTIKVRDGFSNSGKVVAEANNEQELGILLNAQSQ